MTECKHGLEELWCGTCSGADDSVPSATAAHGTHGGETKQEVVNDICDQLAIPRLPVSTGSSIPSEIFVTAADRLNVPSGSMPEVAEAIVLLAGHVWSSAYDSRDTLSGGGSTVTLPGLQAVRRALMVLL